ncbi:MAG TPA: hypothetical protein VHW00_06885 [Thermoanaerobaculia bacterium]|nr:hypothetical protein [Thermoanaerobaculia bacterium]
MKRLRVVPMFVLLAAVGCASAPPVNMDAPRRVVGTESSVRVDAEVVGEEMRAGVPLPITYEVTNHRKEIIAIADIVPETTYDAESNTLTVNIGSEVPGASLLPRLIAIGPGEKKTFNTSARVAGIGPKQSANPQFRPSLDLRIKVNFLGNTEGFEDLIAMTQKATGDAKRADEVFPVWLERNEAVYTNAIPMRWMGRATDATSAPPPADATTRRRRRG